MKKMAFLIVCFGFFTSVSFADDGIPDSISLDRESPSVNTYGETSGNIYEETTPGTGGYDVSGPGPELQVLDINYGITSSDNNDGHSNGEVNPDITPVIYFSADDSSTGLTGTEYNYQAIREQAAGDRFQTNGRASLTPVQVMQGAGTATIVNPIEPGNASANLLSLNQDNYNEIPTIDPDEYNTYVANAGETVMDDMDALELTLMGNDINYMDHTNIFFSLDSISPSLGLNYTAGDILLSQANTNYFELFASYSTLGLSEYDDVDALAVYDEVYETQLNIFYDYALFSLAPDSPFLYGPDGIKDTIDDYSPADIFVTDFSGANALYLTAESLGLDPDDNLDALDISIVPIPGAVWLFVSGLLGFLGFRKKGRHTSGVHC